MGRIANALLLSGGLWLLGEETIQAESWRYRGREGAERPSSIGKRSHSAEASFEALRMISTGMTKAEVLSRVGSPRYTFRHARSNQWVYNGPDRWIVEVTFSGDRVMAINWSRP